MKTRILTRSQVRELVDMRQAVEAVEGAFAAYGRGEGQMPAKVYLSLPEHDGDFRAMPASLGDAAGVKWVNSHPQNPERHQLPAVMGVYILSDPATALPLAVMDFSWLTAVRTGAAGAVASRYLAVSKPASISFIGCGVQARVLLDAHRVLFGDMELLMADSDSATAERFAAEAGGKVVDIERAAAADIVCTATPAREPLIADAWVRGGTHINAMGADAPGKQELDPALLRRSRLVIDDHHQAVSSGEINVAYGAGTLAESDIYGNICEIAAGVKAGREGDEVTIFDSTGLGIQDVALAQLVYRQAVEKNVGTEVDLVA